MASIFAIGGGEVSTGETGAIDREIRDAIALEDLDFGLAERLRLPPAT